jgi:RNA polymerase sigma-70 factor, ECF subfamily
MAPFGELPLRAMAANSLRLAVGRAQVFQARMVSGFPGHYPAMPMPRAVRVELESAAGALQARACEGPVRDVSRVQRIVLEQLNAIWRTARRLGVPPSDIDDVAQEVTLVILRRESAIQPGRERAFVIGTTARIASNWRRWRRRQPQPLGDAVAEVGRTGPAAPADAGHPAQEASIERAQGLALLEAALQEMTPRQRLVFTLFELEELSAREIAEQLEIPEAAVVSRLRRAREVFQSFCRRRQLDGNCPPEENGNG